jgi:hypothetical protein
MPEFSSPAPINIQHDVSAFDCGKQPLNDFLQRHALDKQNAKLSRTRFNMIPSPNNPMRLVLSYKTLASVFHDDPPS